MLDELQCFVKKLFDLRTFLAFEELRRSGDQSLHHTDAVRACTAACFCNLLFGFRPVSAFRFDKVEIEVCAGRVNVGIAGVFLLGALIVRLDAADLRSLVLGKS